MNPNSISHRLFVAAVAAGRDWSGKRPAAPTTVKAAPKPAAKGAARPARALSQWTWSGWQHPTI